MRFVIPFALALTGCHITQALPIGPPMKPLPHGCPVRQELITPDDASARYQQVGVICHSDYLTLQTRLDAFDSLERQDFEREVCELGGEIVVVNGFCSIGKASGVEWRAYRASKRQPSPL